MNQIPLLFLGDAPNMIGGLSRVGRDLALLATKMDEFRVGFLGRGGVASSKFPWMQYNYPESHQWGEGYIEAVWKDFARGELGIIMTIWDPSRLLWFASPRRVELEFLVNPPFQRWGYFPIDHEGPNGQLTAVERVALEGYDRHLAYGIWGSTMISHTLGLKEAVDWLPHGINLGVFKPRDGKAVRMGYHIGQEDVVVGCVMTNQWRKDWGLAFEIIHHLRGGIPNLRALFKVDSIDRYWDLRALATDFGLGDMIVIDASDYSDEEMACFYSACDVTMLPSLGEGFGYPIVESLACGVPVVHGAYGGGAELLPTADWLVSPVAFRYDTRHNCRRPVYNAGDWTRTILKVLEQKNQPDMCRASVEHLDWKVLSVQWKKWFKEGVA